MPLRPVRRVSQHLRGIDECHIATSDIDGWQRSCWCYPCTCGVCVCRRGNIGGECRHGRFRRSSIEVASVPNSTDTRRGGGGSPGVSGGTGLPTYDTTSGLGGNTLISCNSGGGGGDGLPAPTVASAAGATTFGTFAGDNWTPASGGDGQDGQPGKEAAAEPERQPEAAAAVPAAAAAAKAAPEAKVEVQALRFYRSIRL